MKDKEQQICKACDYIYDPAVGDPERGIPPGTAFSDLPGDWVCPVCKKNKNFFAIHDGDDGANRY